MKDEIRRRLQSLYHEVDAAVLAAGPKCESSGRCCHFDEWGHVLYLSSLEAELLLESAPPYPTPVTPARCPFQKEGLCTTREPRPLGCRIYFCDPTYQGTGERIMEDALRKLKAIVNEFELPWQYAPLHHFLNEVRASESPHIPDGGRVALPILVDKTS